VWKPDQTRNVVQGDECEVNGARPLMGEKQSK
jgi:hypothetical protein